MTDVMREAGVAGDAVVDSVGLESFIGTGQMGRNARYRLSWNADAGGPQTVVAKLQAEDEAAKATGFATGGYRKKHVFYSELGPTVSVRKPEIYTSRIDEEA